MKTDEKEFGKRCSNEERNAIKNMEMFWSAHGKDTVAKFSKLTKCWPQKEEGKKEPKTLLQQRLESSPILLITANRVEANMMVRLLSYELHVNKQEGSELSTITDNGCKFHFGFIGNNRVVHVQPKDMSSYTKEGSFSALESVLRRYKPQLVISIGVAFGNDATKQNLGDVLVSKQLFPYDSSNKYSEKSMKLNGSPYETNSQLLCGWRDLLEYEEFPREVIDGDEYNNAIVSDLDDGYNEKISALESKTFKWYCGTVLSGGSVVDDVEQKVKLLEGAECRGIEDVIGGEMEGSGIYFACDKEKIPCIVIKGICDWGIKKNSWDEVLKDVENPPDNKTVKDCVQALAFTNAFSALRCLLEYDNSMISENGSVRDMASVSKKHLFTTKSLEQIMMKLSTFNFPPYFFLGTVCILLSFLFNSFPPELFERHDIFIFIEIVLITIACILFLGPGLQPILLKRIKQYESKTHIGDVFPILIFGDANLFLFMVNIYIRTLDNEPDMGINKATKYFPLVYGGFLCVGIIVWTIAKRLRARPENLELLFANFAIKNLNFEKCCCIIQSTSETVLYSMSVGWICKTQLSPVQIHKCGTIRNQNNLLITCRNWEPIAQEKSFTQMPEVFCPIIPDTLQINYRMPNGDLVVHIITKTPKDIVKRDSASGNGFCTCYMERILLYRDGRCENVLKRVCNSQIIRENEACS